MAENEAIPLPERACRFTVYFGAGGATPLFEEMRMSNRFMTFAMVAALAAGTSTAAMAQYSCPPGYAFYGGVCQPAPTPGYPAAPTPGYPTGPVSGAAQGGAAGAAQGGAAAGPVGAVVGGALGTATGAVTGTANALAGATAPPSTCGPGYVYYNGGCYPQ
jgi:hypothetical protein